MDFGPLAGHRAEAPRLFGQQRSIEPALWAEAGDRVAEGLVFSIGPATWVWGTEMSGATRWRFAQA